mmetsp:Transcript_22559/g.53522  ORF Transcript_22559/g.53522 Transcript_22559/m.53522 type:complete len:87 (+) Transcript_22559:539-799(+)
MMTTGDQMNIMNELMKGDNQRQHKLIGKTGRSAITLKVDNSSNLVSKSDLLKSNRQDVVELPLVPFLVSSSRCTRPSGLAPSRKPI